MKEFADDYFRCDGNGRKFSKWIENTVGKEEIAHYEHYFSFPYGVLKRLVLQTCKDQGLFWKGLRSQFDSKEQDFHWQTHSVWVFV